MSSEVIAALGLDKESLQGQIVSISEENNANSNFLISCILADAISKNQAICLLTFHNSFRHYHNVGVKLGYNLENIKNSQQLIAIEIFKSVLNHFNPSENSNDILIVFFKENKTEIINDLFHQINNAISSLLKVKDSVCLIIDDLSHLLDLGIPINEIISFKQMLKNLVSSHKNQIELVVNIACTNKEDVIVSNAFKHVADLCISVSGLKTGRSNVVSGVLKIDRREEYKRSWACQKEYHFKTYDRQIKLFAIGTAALTS